MTDERWFGHPRGLSTLFFTEMWERFSYYGMRAILVLFMTNAVATGGMGLDDVTATAVYGLYTAAVYIVTLPGGWVADRLLGLRRSVSDLQLALKTIKAMRGGVCVVLAGKVVAKVALPIAGLLSEKRATAVAKESALLKTAWTDAGCALPYMGFNLIPLSVIPEIRITDKGLVTVPGMQILPLFE